MFRTSLSVLAATLIGLLVDSEPRLCLGQESAAVGEAETTEEPQSLVVAQWHPLELSFRGPETSEQADLNPFTDYRLDVVFRNGDELRRVRGFYAADGNAAVTGAESGNVWKVRFTPSAVGDWSYEAALRRGSDVAIAANPDLGERIGEFANGQGTFRVVAAKTRNTDNFRDRGFLIAKEGYFRFAHSNVPWLKGGCDSPENLLAYVDFDGTYRMLAEARDGEAAAPKEIHSYAPHVRDWKQGDPTWGSGKGKGLIGGINYLASQGVNSMYFLTMNIEGDGKDVWPFASTDDFTRFDCSKLDQWNVLFDHMQQLGVALHVVTQETENERLLDDGDTGRLRKLYYYELVSRFAHHPALIWNLGEENGPADFSPNGQTNDQQLAMAGYLREIDPYRHPIVIHTHSTVKGKEEILPGLLGHVQIDGLAFQVDSPPRVHREIIEWRQRSIESGHRWLIGMDEIGKWDTGVVPDSVDPTHDATRREVLWGSLMAGAAGVEWYFGAKQPHNDLTCEDWRQRQNMWIQTTVARRFFEQHLPFDEMQPADELASNERVYCFAKPADTYLIYLPAGETTRLKLDGSERSFSVFWFDPIQGGALQQGKVSQVSGKGQPDLGNPPASPDRDWVILVKPAN